MKSIFKLLIFIAMITSIAACKKGDTGAQGPAGPQGPQGTQGIVGEKGADGSAIFSGTAVPAVSIGKLGDYYLRTSTGVLYGPKVAAGWGTGVNLRGSNGASGSKILSGTTIPTTAQGAVGDFYFQTNNYLFYGPKTAAGWGAAVNLRGATGTANVIYSGWMTGVRTKDSVIDNSLMKVTHIYAPRLSQDILERGTVLIYFNYGSTPFPLPFVSNAAGYVSTISYLLKLREIVITRFRHDNNAVAAPLGSNLRYRYVIIPGGTIAKWRDEKKIDVKNPQELARALEEFGN